jgi:periplasmic divalent cation tolerance protein
MDESSRVCYSAGPIPHKETTIGATTMPDANDLRVVLITIDSAEAARELANRLVRERLAACVNIVPGVTSVYEWDGAIQQESELLLIVKTNAGRYPALEAAVREHHPYTNPEILALASAAVAEKYRNWVNEGVAPRGSSEE